MRLPQWFSITNDKHTDEDIREALEYEQIHLQMAKDEYSVSTGSDMDRLYLDVVHGEYRVAQLEGLCQTNS